VVTWCGSFRSRITHLSPTKSHFVDNWAPLAAWIKAAHPDLVIHTGDVTIDGADSDAHLHHCAGLLRLREIPVRVVPGNHDVGDANHNHQPINADRLVRWQRHFGPDRWFVDFGGWRLIGLDAMLCGSGLPEERAQLGWLEAAMQEADGRRLAWFLHRPLFIGDPQEGDTGYWSIRPEPRSRLLALVRQARVALVASGHLHIAHDFERDGTRYLWGPSSGFLGGPGILPAMPGKKRLGAVLYELDGSVLRAQNVGVPGLAEHWIDQVIDEIYPAHRDTRPGATG
jgi:3',5'-cyclic AMP phosphodiesterase CpdA